MRLSKIYVGEFVMPKYQKFIREYVVEPVMDLPYFHRVIEIGHGWNEKHGSFMIMWAEVIAEDHRENFSTTLVETGTEVPVGMKHAYTWCEGPDVKHLYVSERIVLKHERDRF
jgi:hypothetical protein